MYKTLLHIIPENYDLPLLCSVLYTFSKIPHRSIFALLIMLRVSHELLLVYFWCSIDLHNKNKSKKKIKYKIPIYQVSQANTNKNSLAPKC